MKAKGYGLSRQVLSAIIFGLLILGLISSTARAQEKDTLWIEKWDASWEDRWSVDFGTWEVGMPTSGPDTTHEGPMCAATILAGNYEEGKSTRLMRYVPFTVPSASNNPRLRFWHWYNFGAGDVGEVQVRVAGDTTGWQLLDKGIYGSQYAGAEYGHYYTTEHWTHPKLDLSAYAGKTIELCFYFYASTYSGEHVGPGWYIDEVTVETGAYTYHNPEDWESGFDDWYTDFGTWEVGTPSVVGPDSAYEGKQCAGTILDGNYYDYLSSRLISPSFTVPSASNNPRLRFWHWYNFGAGDVGEVQVRVVGDTTGWQLLDKGIYGSQYAGAEYGHYYTTEHWTRPKLDLSAYAGETIELCFYFYASTYSGEHDGPGWYIDEILVETGAYTYHNPEDWESGFDDWYTDFGTWEVGTPSVVGPDSAYEGKQCAGTILDGNYYDYLSSRLISPSFTVPSASNNPRLRFWHWYNFGAGDVGEVQVRVVGDTTGWQLLDKGIYGSQYAGAEYGHYYTTEHWTRPKLDLSAYAGETIELCFYFYASTYSGEHDGPGWYIDEILVETGAYTYHNPEDWESGFDDWYTDFGTWEVGTPSVVGPDSAYEGKQCAGTILDGNYYDDLSSRLISPSFMVPSASNNPRLRFWHWYNFGAGDVGEVQVRVAGDTTGWQLLDKGIYGSQYAGAEYGHYYTTEHWTHPKLDLSAYAGKTIELCFYFYASTYSGEHVGPGWYIDEVTVETGAYTYHNPEDWESGFDDWYTDFGTWEVGTPSVVGPDSAYEGKQCAGTILDGNYYDYLSSRLISPSFTVPSASNNPRLRFWHWYNFGAGDVGEVQVRVVGDTTGWQLLDKGIYGSQYAGAEYGHYYTTEHWTRPKLDLSAYAGETIELCFYFYASTYSGEHDGPGWYIDEILVETGAYTYHNPEDWESGFDDWYTDFGTWEVGTPSVVGPSSACEAAKCAGTILDGNYYDDLSSRLISPPFVVPETSSHPVLRFRHWYSFNSYDYGQVQVRVAGQSTWRVLQQYTGNSAGQCTYPRIDSLLSYAGQTVELCFYFYSSGGGNVSPGWYVDDIEITTTCPYIYCPLSAVNATASSQGQVLVPLQIWNADSVFVSNGSWSNDTLRFVADTMGAYDFTVVAKNIACADTCSFTVNISGVKVADEMVAPGGTVVVPIRLHTDQPLWGYTIPLEFTTTQPGKVHLDSVRIDPLLADSAIIMPDSIRFIVRNMRPMQLPPLPPDTAKPYTVAEAYFSVAADAQPEVISIDTATMTYNSKIYTYQFIDTLGTAYVPLFVPGSITITDTVVYACGDLDADGMISITDAVYLIAYIFSGGPTPLDVSGGDVDCSGSVNIADVVYMIQHIFGGGPAPCANCTLGFDLPKKSIGKADVWLEETSDKTPGEFLLKVNSDVAVQGLQIALSGLVENGTEIISSADGMTLFSGDRNGSLEIGLIDLAGAKSIPAGESTVLRLKTTSGEFSIGSAILVDRDALLLNVAVVSRQASGPAIPKEFALEQNYPNPFNPSTIISFALPRPSLVKLEVFNLLGQEVTVLANQQLPAGVHHATWDGHDNSGNSVGSGVYFFRIVAGDFTSTRKMLLVK